MKIRRNALFSFSAFVLSLLLVINPLGRGKLSVDQVQAQSAPRPYVVLVNGYEDCCVWNPSNRGVYMVTVLRELERRGAEFRLLPWDTFRDGARQRSRTSNDAAFLQEAADFINNRLDRNRPLILIGHSFGGDSLLSLAPRINRQIQFLGVIDPTAAGGLREPVTRRGVPSNVDYFFNRWQQNALASANVVPFDSRLVSGSISGCRARTCDQQEQSLARSENGSEIRIPCESWEVSCPGYQPWPGGSNGTKAKRLAHNDMPSDAYLQRQMADRIGSVLTNFSPSLSNTRQSIVGLRGIVHLQNIGDVSFQGGAFAGTRGESRRLEGFSIAITDGTPNLGIQYMAHLQNIGDTTWVNGGQFIGTRGESRRLEGFAIRLTGSAATNYNIRYICHLQDIGDTPVRSNGEFCGTRGESRRLEGLQVWIERR